MNRRKFIRNISFSGAGAVMLGGVPVKALSGKSLFELAALANNTDSVLVFIQLHGGNDALNTLIPVSQYDRYYEIRANLAIPQSGDYAYRELDPNLAELSRVGVHPEMLAIKEMYDEGKVAVIQNVGYPSMNLSHFEGRDLVFMGADGENERLYSSGWMGRFLDHTYPGYPDSYPSSTYPDPLGIELSGTQSLAYHRKEGIPIGLAFNSPNGFYNLINSVGVEPPVKFPDSYAGEEIKYIMEFEKKNNQYSERIRDVYNAGSNSKTYPDAYERYAPPEYINNPLAPQLKTIARLLAGGIKTRIFLCRIGGFDTHGDQVVKDNPWLGLHAALMYHLSEGVKAFYDDMKDLGVDHKVLSMTFTEFGRRAYSNDSLGTDHGTSTPVLLFGTGLNAGVYGQNPSLAEEDLPGGNLKYNIDYRQIYTSVVQDWFGADDAAMKATGFDSWIGEKLPLIKTTGVDTTPYQKNGGRLKIVPNPVVKGCKLEFFLKKQGEFSVSIFNTEGKRVYEAARKGVYGMNNVDINASGLKQGNYVVQVRSGKEVYSSTLIKK